MLIKVMNKTQILENKIKNFHTHIYIENEKKKI